MIKSLKPVPMAEVKEIIKDLDEKKNLEQYIKLFNKLTNEKANGLIDEVIGLDNLKIKEEHAVKIADFMPKNSDDVNKIFNDVSLNEEEINAILEIVKKY